MSTAVPLETGAPAGGWTADAMERRVIRYADLMPCKNAFVDSRTPGSDQKENFTLIGPGVSENPNQHVHIAEPHGFNIGGARQPPGCLNSQHSHLTAEVFVVHTGRWRFMFGPECEDGSIELKPGDTISIPTHMFRGFENIGEETGFLLAVLGGDNPGKVTWTPKVFDLAEKYGLVLLEGGRLVDTTQGESVPEGARREARTSPETVARLATPVDRDLEGACVARLGELTANDASPLAGDGVAESGVIVPNRTGDGFEPGPISGWWPHGFNLRLLTFAPTGATPWHERDEEEVLFLHAGSVDVAWYDGAGGSGTLTLAPGDTMTVPKGVSRRFVNRSEERPDDTERMTDDHDGVSRMFVVRGGDAPAAPRIVREVA